MAGAVTTASSEMATAIGQAARTLPSGGAPPAHKGSHLGRESHAPLRKPPQKKPRTPGPTRRTAGVSDCFKGPMLRNVLPTTPAAIVPV